MRGSILTIFLGLLLAIFSSAFGPSAQAACFLMQGANVRTVPFEDNNDNIIFRTRETWEVVVFQVKSPWNFVLAVTDDNDYNYPPLGWVHRSQLRPTNCRELTNYRPSTPRGWREGH